MIRQCLKRKYHYRRNISMPILSFLLGNDFAKDIKTCDSVVVIGKEAYYRRDLNRRRGNCGFHKRDNYGYNSGYYFNSYNSGRVITPITILETKDTSLSRTEVNRGAIGEIYFQNSSLQPTHPPNEETRQR